ncbi:ATP-binding protein [Tsukamurella pseudospumae]|uniref:ATP/GTP-binding protein n=1 Tax=Tsukamurella pseudospumae TaxID=239498 RepID=A0A137ZT00_9ACTN|nr:ATP-binding protein [Tsukamurella pseudospumae]KXP01297.1 ATP/GTP-binding protein [Tsukamurella pseudospumae]
MVVADDDPGAENRRLPTVTLDGWRQFVQEKPATLTLSPRADIDGMDIADREAYDERRIAYHSELVVVETAQMRAIINRGRMLTLLNQREISARRSLIVDGPWASGKSTTIKMLGKVHEQTVRRRWPGQDRIPVVYITTPPKGSPRKLASEFAHFLGIPSRARFNTSDIADAVCHVLTEARTDLVIVDEIHNLNLATSAGEDMSDHLKYFTEHMPATFVYAGINVERSGLFTGVRGKQISGRSVLMRTGTFACDDEWRGLVATLDTALRLYEHAPGTLTRNAKFLHRRTGGSISSLSQLVRSAALTAIMTGSEAVTRQLLEETPVDHAAEQVTPRDERPAR